MSWVRRRHPHSQRTARRRAWLRYGLGGEAAIRLARVLSPGGLCCPPRSVLLWSRLLGYDPPETPYLVSSLPKVPALLKAEPEMRGSAASDW